ncbi:uncharacterized protein FTOL_01261 [Fusarium torulosum]|uniref:Uncharacterized protein n=1 Tax=Fusarium torulosum TaxID=33205 RepID=A0AAE8SD89_9HYPO|nr:uncharacterized protein FTOL_01261 [Fusarium torulosum]
MTTLHSHGHRNSRVTAPKNELKFWNLSPTPDRLLTLLTDGIILSCLSLALTNDHTLTHTLPCRVRSNPGALGPGLRSNGSLSSASAMACSLPMGDVIGTSPEIPGGPLVGLSHAPPLLSGGPSSWPGLPALSPAPNQCIFAYLTIACYPY